MARIFFDNHPIYLRQTAETAMEYLAFQEWKKSIHDRKPQAMDDVCRKFGLTTNVAKRNGWRERFDASVEDGRTMAEQAMRAIIPQVRMKAIETVLRALDVTYAEETSETIDPQGGVTVTTKRKAFPARPEVAMAFLKDLLPTEVRHDEEIDDGSQTELFAEALRATAPSHASPNEAGLLLQSAPVQRSTGGSSELQIGDGET